jgi:uncharacterized protein YqjF (DUF2071 family)
MVHDRWANVLFLHWRVPAHLESTLEADTAPFVVEKYDGSAWIGLVLLTEEGVGPSIGRTPWTCVNHHGINLRTYVKGELDANASGGGGDDDDDDDDDDSGGDPKQHQNQDTATTRGIHFSSLECDDEFTSFGANFFGMPYRIAEMKRIYGFGNSDHDSNNTGAPEGKDSSSISSSPSRSRCYYRIRSERLPSGSPSFVRLLFHALNWWRPRVLHSTTSSTTTTTNGFKTGTISVNNNHLREKGDDHFKNIKNRESSSKQFMVDCSWSRCCSHENQITNDDNDDDDGTNNDSSEPPSEGPSNTNKVIANNEPFREWAAERYFVYTHKYGRNWRGRVDHEPWPLETIKLEDLVISGVDAYEPINMRPMLRYMADHKPDHVGFSQGVGPVTFTMLQPV